MQRDLTTANPVDTPALLGAWRRMSKAVRSESYSFDRAAKTRLEANPAGVCHALDAQLAAGSYQPQPLQMVHLPKKTGGLRTLMIPCLLDRLVQSALTAYLSERLDANFSPNSYGYRPRRSVAQAQDTVRVALRAGAGWVLDADIRACFDEIFHAPLIAALKARGVWEYKAAWLMRQMLRAEVRVTTPDTIADASFCIARGLAQGSPLAPLFCNITLDALDRAFAEADIAFVRYADDFVAFATSQAQAADARELAERTLKPLGLTLHPEKTRIVAATAGFRFLGGDFATDMADSQWLEPTASPSDAAEEIQHPATLCAASESSAEIAHSTAPGERAAGPPAAIHQPTSNPVLDEQPLTVTEEGEETNEPLLRTLYLLEPRVSLERDAGILVAIAPGREPIKVPAARLHQVMAFGETNITSGAISLCLEHSIPVMLLAGRGKYFGVIDPIRVDNVARQRAQFAALEREETCRSIRNAIISGKLHNAARVLRRWARSRELPALDIAAERVSHASTNALGAQTEASLRGIEGAAAAEYFSALSQFLPPQWGFSTRKRQPPTDPVNSLLSYGYVLLYYNILTLVVARGLHPHLGFFHATRSGHHALVSDLMEEFRAPIIDALVVDMVTHGRLSPEDFTWPDAPGEPCLMSAAARRGYVHAFEKKLNTVLKLSGEPQPLDYRRRIDTQILQLCGVLDGSYTQYLPFRIKA